MDIRSRAYIEQLYFLSFAAVLVFLPWSIRLCSYSIVAMFVIGLLTTSGFKKIQQLRQHPHVLLFVVFYALYGVGILYTSNLAEAFRSLEQKLALLVVPLIAASSIPFTERQRKQVITSFVCSNILLSLTCVGLNILFLYNGNDQQLNFDFHTLSRFQELHAEASPLWMRFSYVSFTNFFIGPTYFAIYLTFSILALSYYNIFATKLRYVIIGWFAVVVVLLSSRMGILLLMGVGSIHLAYQLFKRNFSLKESLTATGFVVALCLLILISPVTRFRVLEEPLSTPMEIPSSPENWNSVNLRLLEWGSSVEGIKEYGIKGTGTGGTLDVLHAYYKQAPLGGMDMGYNAHNQYLETYLEIGVACLLIPMQHAIKANHKLLLFLILMVGAGCLTTCMFEKARGLMFYVAFVSLFMFTQSKDDSQAER
jgi:hypothetical protein